MKPVILGLVCVSLVGCTPKPATRTSNQGPPSNLAEPCLPAKTACIVSVGGVSLIRAPTFWLIDLRGGKGFDVAAMIDAAKQCDGPQGCGIAMTKSEIEVLVGELAQAKVEQLAIPGGLVATHRVEPQKTMLEIGGDLARFEKVAPQLSDPTQWIWCIPAQCDGPPPPPVGRDFSVDDFFG